MELELRYTLDTIGDAVQRFRAATRDQYLFAFSGEMGAGKTTFIHKLCDYLQVEDVVSSPTFALINEYHFNEEGEDKIIYHLDWYRLKSVDEAIMAGMEDCIDQAAQREAMCFVEWPEKATELLKKPYCRITIELVSDVERVMRVSLIA